METNIQQDDAREIKLLKLHTKNHRAYWLCKRTFDVIASFVGIVVLSPLLLLLCLLVWLDDPHGSPVYKQIRVGRHGKEFNMYKFRTMVINAEELLSELVKDNEKNGPVFKMKHDPRVTRLGRILRRTSLDELPQLFNVLKGDMTIVGPRPPLPREVAEYDKYQRLRLMVTPGLTCFWQVQPKRDEVPFEHWIEMDIDYICERSMWKDMKLILLTIKSVINGDGV